MKFSLEWLKYFLDTEASVADISAKLNAIGLEVDGIEDPADKLTGFRVAHVLTAKPHPDADKLQVLTVDTGEGDPLQVVCGAPNARPGLKAPLATIGSVIPGGISMGLLTADELDCPLDFNGPGRYGCLGLGTAAVVPALALALAAAVSLGTARFAYALLLPQLDQMPLHAAFNFSAFNNGLRPAGRFTSG